MLMMWELLSFIQGRTRSICLKELMNGPRTPGMISKSSGKNLSHISRALKELRKKGLAECKNPKSAKNRFYQITKKGEELWATVEKINRT